MFLFCLVFAMFCARLFICALWSPAGKGLTSWLSFVFVTFPLVSWVRCGTWLYRFLIFATLLLLIKFYKNWSCWDLNTGPCGYKRLSLPKPLPRIHPKGNNHVKLHEFAQELVVDMTRKRDSEYCSFWSSLNQRCHLDLMAKCYVRHSFMLFVIM